MGQSSCSGEEETVAEAQRQACDEIGDEKLLILFSELPGVESDGKTLDLKEMKAFVMGGEDDLLSIDSAEQHNFLQTLVALRAWDTDGNSRVNETEWLFMWRRVIWGDDLPALPSIFAFFTEVARLRGTLQRKDCRERLLFHRLDLDDNGSIDLPELVAFCKGFIAREDGNSGDGKADGSGVANAFGGAGAEEFLNFWDGNKDGKISEEEWVKQWISDRKEQGAEATREVLAFMERAAVNAEEMRERSLFYALDFKETGYLDLTELTTFLDRSDSVMHLAGTAPRFLEQLDVDGDGVVSLAEWISLWRRTKAAAGVQKTKGHYRFFHRAIEVAKQKREN